MENPFEKLSTEILDLKEFVKSALDRAILNKDGLDKDEFMGVQQTAVYMGLKVSTIYAYTRSKKIRHYKRGTTLYFKKSEINAYIEKGLIEPKTKLKNNY